VDDGVEDGEDTDEMDLAALQKEFAADDDDDEAENQGQFSPKVTQVRALPCSPWPRVSICAITDSVVSATCRCGGQELDLSIDEEVTSLAQQLKEERKPSGASGEEDIPWDSPKPNKKRKLESGSKRPCAFGAKCYRKYPLLTHDPLSCLRRILCEAQRTHHAHARNADHRAQFSHPGDEEEAAAVADDFDEDTAAPKPKKAKQTTAPMPAVKPKPKPAAKPKPKPTSAKKSAAGLASVVQGKVVVLTGALIIARKDATTK
jgi:hypothetical protein